MFSNVKKNKKICLILLCFLLVSLFTVFASNGIVKTEASELGRTVSITYNREGGASVEISIAKDTLTESMKNETEFSTYVKNTIKTLTNSAKDSDILSIKKIQNKSDRFVITLQTRRLNSNNNKDWGWFDWSKANEYTLPASDSYIKLQLLEKGNFKSSLLNPTGLLTGKINITNASQYNNGEQIKLNFKDNDNKTLSVEEFSKVGENLSNDYKFVMIKIPNVIGFDKITVNFPGKVSYVSSSNVETSWDNQINLLPFTLKANTIGYEYVTNDQGEIQYDKLGVPLTKEIINNNVDVSVFYAYAIYQESPNWFLIGLIIVGSIALITFIVLGFVKGWFKKFFTSKTFNKIKKHKLIYLMLLPSAILAIIFCYVPMIGVVIVFKDFNIIDGIFDSEWVGLKFFKFIFMGVDENVFLVFRNTLYISLIRIATNFPAILIFALMINEIGSKRWQSVVRTVSYLPNFISWIAIGGMMTAFFSVDEGVFNKIATMFSGHEVKINWYAENKYWWSILALSSMWKSLGWGTIIYMSALGCIDSELYDACSIDGGGRLRKIITVTIPGIMNVIMLQLIMDAGNLMRDNYEQILALTQGSGALSDTTYVVGSLSYSAVLSGSGFSQATAFGLIQGLIGLVLVVVVNKISKKTDNEGVI